MFLPKKQTNKRYLTLLFTDQALKTAKLNSKGDRLEELAEFPLPDGLIFEGEIQQPKKLTQSLKGIKAKIGLKDRFVVVGLSELKASTHSLTLPLTQPGEIDSAVRFEADSFLPFPYKDEYLDWMLIDQTKEGRSKVLVSAVPKKIIDNYTACLEAVGWQPIAFETTSLSLLRLLPPEGRKSSFAAEVAQTAVVLILGLKGNIEACSVIRKSDDLLATIRKMSEFYFAPERDGQAPQKIYLCGPNANQDLFVKIKRELGMEPLILKKSLTDLPENKQVQLATLMSLAQKRVAPPADEKTINILPETLLAKYHLATQERKEKVTKAILIFLLILFNTACWLTFWQTKTEFDKQEAKLQSPLPYQETQFQEWMAKAKLINQQAHQGKLVGQVLESGLNLPRPKINLSGISYKEDNQVILTGRADNRQDLLDFKAELEKNGLFSQVLVPLSALQQEQNVEFRITLTVSL